MGKLIVPLQACALPPEWGLVEQISLTLTYFPP